MNNWFTWYEKLIHKRYDTVIDFSEDNVIDYVIDDVISVGYISGRWFIRKDTLFIEVYDPEGKGTYISETYIIILNWCSNKER